MSKKFDKYIEKAEQFLGDVMVEYAQNDGADEEMLCSGEWQPSPAVMKDAMSYCLCDFADVRGDELRQCTDYWYKQNYGD